MTRYLAHFIILAGVLGLVLSVKYNGYLPGPGELYFALCLLLVIRGIYMLAETSFRKMLASKAGRSQSLEIKNGKLVQLTLENCEVKSRSFQEEILDDAIPGDMKMLDALVDADRNYRTEIVVQTYIVFRAKIRGRDYKSTSSPTSLDPFYVKEQLMQGNVTLVFNSQDPEQYVFRSPFL